MHFNGLNHAVKERTLNARSRTSLIYKTSWHSVGVFCLVFGKILIMSIKIKIKIKTTIKILSQTIYIYIYIYIAYPAPLSFCLICADPFAKLLKLHFNHQCNDASIYLTSTCLQRVDVDIL